MHRIRWERGLTEVPGSAGDWRGVLMYLGEKGNWPCESAPLLWSAGWCRRGAHQHPQTHKQKLRGRRNGSATAALDQLLGFIMLFLTALVMRQSGARGKDPMKKRRQDSPRTDGSTSTMNEASGSVHDTVKSKVGWRRAHGRSFF